jgi:hypothetical protein
VANKNIASASALFLAVIVGVLVGDVGELDLTLIVVPCPIVGLHDFWATIGRKREAG